MNSKPEKTVIKAWRLRRMITLAVIIIVFIILLTMALMHRETWYIVGCTLIGVFMVYKIIGLWIYPLIEYRQWEYMLSDEKMEITHGIFFIRRDIIPVIRIQNITVKQGPVYRQFDLHSVEIALASGTFEIVGLSIETAEDIAEKVRKKLYMENNCTEGM